MARPTNIVDRFTGLPPTDEEWRQIEERARQIIDNWKYSSPELLDWAMHMLPEYFEQICGTYAGGSRAP